MRMWKSLKGRLDLALSSDTAFIETAYYEILGRRPDLDGLNHYRRVLRNGRGRTAVLLEIMRAHTGAVFVFRVCETGRPRPAGADPRRYSRDALRRAQLTTGA